MSAPYPDPNQDPVALDDGRKEVRIWAVSDGRAGIKNQVLGLAEAVCAQLKATPFSGVIETRDLAFAPIFSAWPNWMRPWPDAMLAKTSDRVRAPWPDLWISAGRASLAFSKRIRAQSQGKTFVVQLQDPRCDPALFDMVIAPEHDQLKGNNVLSILGSTHRVTKTRLEQEYPAFQAAIEAFPRPYVCVLIGGVSKSHDIGESRALSLIQDIKTALRVTRGTLLLSLSRRTPKIVRDLIVSELGQQRGIIYNNEGDNPYFAFLHAADHILVTEDSVNMVTEAASTGKPVHVLTMDRRPGIRSVEKFDAFHLAMQTIGAAHPFSGDLQQRVQKPLDETTRAAIAVTQAMMARLKPVS